MSASGAHNQWWNSPQHRANMLNSSFTEIGLAYGQHSGNGRYYYTMVLGRPSGGGGGSCGSGGGGNPVSGSMGDAGGAGTSGGIPIIPTNRVNAIVIAAPIAVFCLDDGGVDILTIDLNSSVGAEVIVATGAEVASALEQAVTSGQYVTIAQNGAVGLYALSSNEIQAQGRDLREPGKLL